ncbi:MAG: MBL fold metallo-hydrolase [Candidatus Dormibacteria bacterium]
MDVTFHGSSCVRLRGREVQVVVDPHDSALRTLGKASPELIVRTEGATRPELLRPHGDGSPQEVSGPGEYEVRGVRVRGIPSSPIATIMQIELDEVRVVALGALERVLTEDEIDSLGKVDLLLLPVGGGDALGASAATKLVNAIAPAVVVPLEPAAGRVRSEESATVAVFAREMGVAESTVAQAKVSLSSSSVASEDTRVVILESRSS